MTKLKFLLSLHERLSALPPKDVEEQLNFYSEMIEDRMEEGLSEEEAVAQVGSIDEIAAQIAAEIPAEKQESLKPQRKLKAWELTLLILGSPVWFSLLIAAFAVVFSLYISLCAVAFSLWSVFAAVAGVSIGITIFGIFHTCVSTTLPGIALIAAGIVCAGLSIFLFIGCKAITTGTVQLTKHTITSIKTKCTKKEGA